MKLDHVSVAATRGDVEQLGFRVTPTGPADVPRARLFLDCMYLELLPPQVTGQITGRGWFLRPRDLSAAAEGLRRAGIRVVGPTTYRGLDGVWEDVEIEPSSATPTMPILTRRVDRHAVAWPPPLSKAHPNGARTITELHVRTSNETGLLAVLTALGARTEGRRVTLDDGVRVELLPEGTGGEGLAAITIDRVGAAPIRVELDRDTEPTSRRPPRTD